MPPKREVRLADDNARLRLDLIKAEKRLARKDLEITELQRMISGLEQIIERRTANAPVA